MVAKNIRLPAIRKIFQPDYDKIIVDADLAGADAQVVAWTSNCKKLKDVFKSGVKIHVHNARTVWPELTKDMPDSELKEHPIYKENKIACHLTNYGGVPNTIVENVSWDIAKANEFQERWFYLYPEIRHWHNRVKDYLYGRKCWNCNYPYESPLPRCPECGAHRGRTIKNQFGFRYIYFGDVGAVLTEALAWEPQSTVAFAIDLGWTNISEGHEYSCTIGNKVVKSNWSRYLVNPDAHKKWHNIVEFLLQNHDSIVFQEYQSYLARLDELINDMKVIIPFDDPLIIPMSYGYSNLSWGDCKE